jgi:uridine kinase/SAM-dependent methyltransferase
MEVNPSKLIRYDLLVVLIGVACSLAAENVVKVDHNQARLHAFSIWLATAAFFLTSLNFLHAKTVLLGDDEYNRVLVNRTGFALADFVLNVLIALSFVFLALYLHAPLAILVLSMTVRVLDVPLCLLVLRSSTEENIRRAQNSWLAIDLIAIVLFLLCLAFRAIRGSEVAVASFFLASIVLDITIDYWFNYRFYFSKEGCWGDMAGLWDAAQGEHGDIYRRRIIVPALAAASHFEGKAVLDLGCGNGCLSRAFVRLGASSVHAVDQAEEMLESARGYPSDRISYSFANLDGAECLTNLGLFDSVAACFSLQDCSDIKRPLQVISDHMASGAKAFLIFENERAFESNAAHLTTSRIPLDSNQTSGIGQRFLLAWVPRWMALGQPDIAPGSVEETVFFSQYPESKVYSTITRYWDSSAYLREAYRAGLTLACWPEVLRVEGSADGPTLRSYERNPKFSMFVLQKASPPEEQNAVRLLLIAGPSGSGKTTAAEHVRTLRANSIVVSLDDFYFNEGDPRVPKRNGKPDWDSPRSLDLEAAAKAIESLLCGQTTRIPKYEMSKSRAIGYKEVTPRNVDTIIVEGLYAFDLFTLSSVPTARLFVIASARTTVRRALRDIRERRRGVWSAVLHTVRMSLKSRQYEKRYRSFASHKIADKFSIADVAHLLSERE